MPWWNGPVTINPIANQVLVTTDAMPSGIYQLTLLVQSTAQCLVRLQHRNAADTVTLREVDFRIITGEYWNEILGPELDNAERFRVILVAGITGSLEVDLFTVLRQDLSLLR